MGKPRGDADHPILRRLGHTNRPLPHLHPARFGGLLLHLQERLHECNPRQVLCAHQRHHSQYGLQKEDLSVTTLQSLAIKNNKGPFAGNFDGRGHTITGLVFATSRYGFFGDLEDAKISNVTFNFVGLAAPYYGSM